jgi:hypothetical protein
MSKRATLPLDTASVSVLAYEHGRQDEAVIALWNEA